MGHKLERYINSTLTENFGSSFGGKFSMFLMKFGSWNKLFIFFKTLKITLEDKTIEISKPPINRNLRLTIFINKGRLKIS